MAKAKKKKKRQTAGDLIRAQRKKVYPGVSQQKFALECGLSPQALNGIELDKVVPRLGTLKKIAEHLQIDIGKLIVKYPD